VTLVAAFRQRWLRRQLRPALCLVVGRVPWTSSEVIGATALPRLMVANQK
jgi:hypothetical protein